VLQPDELATLLAQPSTRPSGGVTVLDVRWRLGRTDGREAFLAGHVPGAVYVDLESELADPAEQPVGDGGRHPLPAAERFAVAMRRCGVRADRPVVVHDDWSGLAATRAWWLLRHHGHPDVRLLDGGWSAWRDAGHAVETGETTPVPGDFVADPGRLPVLDADGAARVAAEGVLLDARAPERFTGELEPVDPVPGHVPGAVSLPATANLRDGRFRPLAELEALYAGTGGAGPVGAYCGSGVNATHDLFALHLLGREGALYPGSWSGWVSDPARPVSKT
jgi:thiosulfate/3-mercaptopyruvate sulfurtransferase